MERGEKVYIGDGAYIHHDGYHLWLTTSNGIETTNEVAIPFEYIQNIFSFIEKMGNVKITVKKLKEEKR